MDRRSRLMQPMQVSAIWQWEKLKKSREIIIPWSHRQETAIFRIEFVPILGKSLSVYIFYETDAELKSCTESGMNERVRQEFLRILDEIGYVKGFDGTVQVHFDSDEAVTRDYDGNYGARLRGKKPKKR